MPLYPFFIRPTTGPIIFIEVDLDRMDDARDRDPLHPARARALYLAEAIERDPRCKQLRPRENMPGLMGVAQLTRPQLGVVNGIVVAIPGTIPSDEQRRDQHSIDMIKALQDNLLQRTTERDTLLKTLEKTRAERDSAMDEARLQQEYADKAARTCSAQALQLGEMRGALEVARRQIQTLESRMTALTTEVETALITIGQLEMQLERAAAKHTNAATTIAQQQAQIEDLRKDLENAHRLAQREPVHVPSSIDEYEQSPVDGLGPLPPVY